MAKKEIEIEFNPDLFNNIFWLLKTFFENKDVRYIWAYGGSSASKTYSAVQLIIIEMMCGSNNNHMVLRKYATDIKDSIYADFKTIISEWDLDSYFILQQNYIQCTITGSYTRFRGLDESGKIKGLSGFKRVVLDEIDQFDEVDYKQIRKRLRGKEGQQILGLFNPISEEHWIKKNIFDSLILQPYDDSKTPIAESQINDLGNTVVLRTNYLDNKYIVGPHFYDKHVIEDFERDKILDFNYYQIYGLGHWGKLRTGGEFWKDFNSNLHIGNYNWDETLPIHLTFDENVNPYLTCLVWQIVGKEATQIDEICLEDPRNRLKHVCAEFKQRYPIGRVAGLFIYGDRTSWKEDTKKEKGENFFTDIMILLKEYDPKLRLQSVNPSVVQSGGFINQCYAGQTLVTIRIAEKCKKSIHDYQYALEDSDGTLKKTKKTHPVTKVSYEEFGHASDAKRYFITTAFADDYDIYKKGGRKSAPTSGKNISKHGY